MYSTYRSHDVQKYFIRREKNAKTFPAPQMCFSRFHTNVHCIENNLSTSPFSSYSGAFDHVGWSSSAAVINVLGFWVVCWWKQARGWLARSIFHSFLTSISKLKIMNTFEQVKIHIILRRLLILLFTLEHAPWKATQTGNTLLYW